MPRPQLDENWLLQIIELEGDGFVNAGGIRSEMPKDDAANDIQMHVLEVPEEKIDRVPQLPPAISSHFTAAR
jgi:hypothetical protein